MDDQEQYSRLLSALGFRSRVEDAPDGSAVDLLDLDGDPLDPPVRLYVDERSLGEHLRENQHRFADTPESSDSEDSADDDPAAAALCALLVQVEAAVLGREPGHDLVVEREGVAMVAARR